MLSKDSPAVKTRWVSVESPRIFTSTGEIANDFGNLGPDGNGYCDTRIFATYDSGSGAETFLVYTAGYAVYDFVNDLDVSRIRVWVFDTNGNLDNTIRVDGNGIPGWKLTGGRLRVGDFDGDGNDDLMVARHRDDPLGGPIVELRTKVFDLLSGTLKYKITGTGYGSYTNLNP